MEIEKQENDKTPFVKEIEDLLVKEREARLNNDYTASSRILLEIVQLAFDLREYDALTELIALLSKKRGQPKKAMIDMIQRCMTFIYNMPTEDHKACYIQNLKDVCEKKIYLEVEYARCCLLLVKQNEDEQKIEKAAKILQDVQVETYGSMDKREKLEFILYQMKIMLKKKDYLRTLIVSRKINQKNLGDKGIEDLKILFYSYLILYHTHENNYFENAMCYKVIYDTLKQNAESAEKISRTIDFNFLLDMKSLLENYILYLVLDTYNPTQMRYLSALETEYEQELMDNPELLGVVRAFLSQELISIDSHSYGVMHLDIFSGNVENTEGHRKDLKKQLIQHNLRVIAKYYDRISLSRMSQLIGCHQDLTEKQLCESINKKLISAKIDRVQSTVYFKHQRNENTILNEWRSDIHQILDLVDHTCNLINREYDTQINPL